jgi:hypothetical protein
MPQPVTHYLVCEEAFQAVFPELWHSYANFAGFDSFAPDLFYIADIFKNEINHGQSYPELADAIHWNDAFDCFCAMLDYIKANNTDSVKSNKMKAFAYGFYSHVVTDCIFHPYVYRATGDHWLDHPVADYDKHKHIEALMDSYLLDKKIKCSPGYQFNPQVRCGRAENEDVLDEDVHSVFKHGLVTAYPEHIPEHITDGGKYLLKQAYEDFARTLGLDFFLIGKINLDPMNREMIPLIENWNQADIALMNDNRHPWLQLDGNIDLTYSVLDLYHCAVQAVKEILWASEEYLNRNENGKPWNVFYADNYNLDTGLPCSLNDDPINRSPENVRFNFGIDQLIHIYSTLL